MGTDARACFFAEDNLIITEGQEDVVLYPVIMRALGMDYYLPFFGFGAGGASGIIEIAHLLQVLGFERIGAIYDGDKRADYDTFVKELRIKQLICKLRWELRARKIHTLQWKKTS